MGVRLTYLKVTGGKILPKDVIEYVGEGGKVYSEKIEGIRLYSADKYKSLRVAEAGTVCAVVGLTHTRAGGGIGAEYDTSLICTYHGLCVRVLREDVEKIFGKRPWTSRSEEIFEDKSEDTEEQKQ